MSEANPPPADLVTELQVSGHLMQLDAGVYCVYHSPGSTAPDPQTGLPGARLTLPPGPPARGVSIVSFRDDGWIGSLDSAALIRVMQGPAHVLMTIYQAVGATQSPRLQVTKLVEGVQTLAAKQGIVAPPGYEEEVGEAALEPVDDAEIAAHIQRRGDVLARLNEWVGERGSQQWIEGFALSPRGSVLPQDIEYQAVLGRGWLSPWSEGSQYCGSRGMALPILGLRVRLRGASADTHNVQVSATFTDGTAIGPVAAGEACEAESLAPLEAFKVELLPITAATAPRAKPAPAPVAKRAPAPPVKMAAPVVRSRAPVPAPKAKPVLPKGRGR
ncbi:hypothetical protein [Acidisphaera sp. L21]|uniref:hypothetical protein n=1 Tax=Acidisphaera sp. L21 TaxID=1641851 RepID=UPI001C2093F9|nr:hypothetical protein [Acidisphaera sp. L21]